MSGTAELTGRIAPAGGDGRYALTGTVGFATVRALLEDGRRAFAGHPAVALDLSGVAAIDSAGLALLLCWLADARRDGRRVTLEHLPAQLHAIARISDAEALLAC